MFTQGWIRALAFALTLLAAYSAVESAFCAEDAGVCCEETAPCCSCVHMGVPVETPAAQPLVKVVLVVSRPATVIAAWEAEPLFRPPIV